MLNNLMFNVQHTIQKKIIASLAASEFIDESEAAKLSALFKKHILFTMFTDIKVTSPSILSHHLNPAYSNLFGKVLTSYERTASRKMECFEDTFSRFIDKILCGSNEKLNQYFYWNKESWNDIFAQNVKSIFPDDNSQISVTGNGIQDLINLFYKCVRIELNNYISQMKKKADMLKSIEQIQETKSENKYDSSLITQSIIDSQGKKVYSNNSDTENLSLSSLKTFRYLIIANGGMGKTTMLRHILENEKGFEAVFMISLSDLLYRAADSPVYAYSSPKNKNGYILREIVQQNDVDLYDLKNGKFLLLLDGYNEMFDCGTVKNYSVLQSIRKEITWITQNLTGLSVIITSRDIPEYIELESFERCTITEISSFMIDNLLKRDGLNLLLSAEMQQLLTFPLYYKFFLSMERNIYPQTKYQLFEMLHKRCYSQIIEKKDLADQDSYFFIYFVLIPYIGKEMEVRRTDVLTKGEIKFIFSKLISKKTYILHIYNNIFSEHRSGIMLSDAFEDVWEFISRRFDFGETDIGRSEFRFSHQELQEYFAAFSIAHDLIGIPSAYIELSLSDYDLEFNLKSNVQAMILSYLYDYFSLNDKILIYENIFRINHKIVLNYSESMEFMSAKIENEILLAYYAYFFSYHFFVHSTFFSLTDTKSQIPVLDGNPDHFSRNLISRHGIINSICEFCVNHKGLILSMKFSEKVLSSLFDIVCGETEYWRENDLTVCRKYISFIEDLICFLPNKERNLFHMKAKALIKNAENIQSGIEMPSYYEEYVSVDKLFSEAVTLLKKSVNKGFNLSANLLGRLYSEPSLWLLDKKLIEIDRIKAFYIMDDCLKKMTNGWFSQNGTELVYLARSLIFLFLKGYLQMTPQGIPVCNTRHELPNKYSMQYIDSVFEKIQGQDYPLINWAKGWREILKQPSEILSPEIYQKAAGYFSMEKKCVLVDFISVLIFPESDYLNRVYNKDVRFDEVFERLLDSLEKLEYGNEIRCDKMDSFYILSDIKSMFCVIENNMLDTDKNRYFKIKRMQSILAQVESEKLIFNKILNSSAK